MYRSEKGDVCDCVEDVDKKFVVEVDASRRRTKLNAVNTKKTCPLLHNLSKKRNKKLTGK